MKRFIILAILILIIASVPRAIEAVNGNFVFGFDQGKHWIDGKLIVVDHKFPLIGDEVGGKGGFFQGPGFNYLMAVMYFLFSGNPYGSIVCMVIFGIGTIALSLILFERILGKRTSLFIGLLMATSPSMIAQSRFEWPPFIITPLTVFLVYFIYQVLNGRWKDIFWVFLTLGTMAHFEIATAGSLGIAVGIVLVVYVIYKKLPFLKTVLRAGVGFLLPILPLVVFDFRHNFLNLRGIVRLIVSGNAEKSIEPVLSSIANSHLTIFQVNMFGGFETFPFSRIVLLILFLMIFLMYIFDKRIERANKEYLTMLCCIPLVLFLEFLIYKNTLWEWWLLELLVLYCVIAGILTSYVYNRNIVLRIGVLLLLLFQLNSYKDRTKYFLSSDLYDYGGTEKIKGKTEAVDSIFKDANGGAFGVLVFTPPVYTYPYDFLFWWLGTTKYGYVPHQDKKGTFYLLIEPDGSKMWSYKGWLETVIQTGTVVSEETLPSGFIIQKRVAQ